MASSSEDQRKTETSNHPVPDSTQSTERAASQMPSPVTGYPPMMGYPPPPMGYAQQPHPAYYQGYAGYPPHVAPPPPVYYTSQPHQTSGCARFFLLGLIFFVIIILLSSIITWIVLRPQIPNFQVENLAVTNFNTNGSFTANWDGNITVDNINQKLKVYFDRIRSVTYFNENLVSTPAVIDPFSLETKARSTMRVKLATNNTEQPTVENTVVQEMDHDRKTGTVTFTLRIDMWSTFKAPSWWSRHVFMSIYCENLTIGFVGSANNGVLTGIKPRECSVGG